MSNPTYEIGDLIDSTHTLDVHAASRHGARGFRCAVVALSLPSDVARDRVRDEAFSEAAAVLARVRHPNLAAVEDVWEPGGRPWAVVPPLAGLPLSRMLGVPASRAGSVSFRFASDIVLSVAEAAHALSDAVGRRSLGGLSADSIWVSRDGAPLLLPTVCLLAMGRSENEAVARYRAPESLSGDRLDPSADVHALGLLLWDLLALGWARLPSDLGEATCAAPPSIDPRVVELVMRSLSVSPSDRPPNALAFHAELSRLLLSAPDDRDESTTIELRTIEILPEDAPALAVMPAPVRTVSDPARLAANRPIPPRPKLAPALAPPNELRVLRGDAAVTSLVLDGAVRRWVVGRSRSADLVVCDPDMSREHFEIVEARSGEYRVYDLGSKNGLFVNGAAADEHPLRPGDELRAGDTLLRFGP